MSVIGLVFVVRLKRKVNILMLYTSKNQHSHALCLKEQAQIEFNKYRPVVAEATCHSLSPIAKFCRCKVMPIVDVKHGFVELA